MPPFICNIFLLVCLVPISIQIIESLLNIVNLELSEMATYSPTELLRLKIYISLVGSLLLTFPLWFKGFYNFSSTGLTIKERKGTLLSFSTASLLFLTGTLIGLFYISPIIIEILLTDGFITAKLSVYEATKLIISVSIFSGFLISLPIMAFFAANYTEHTKDARKYLYFLILIIAVLGTPEPSMIINLIFLVFFASIAEIVLLVTGGSK